jgi:3-hydroxy-3-methylglutaryl CoA synthase
VFFVSLGGFDNHDGLLTTHPQLLSPLAGALASFEEALAELGVAEDVTTFTASDFGRTSPATTTARTTAGAACTSCWAAPCRASATDGTPPIFAHDGPDDVRPRGGSRPTTSVDQYAATLRTAGSG